MRCSIRVAVLAGLALACDSSRTGGSNALHVVGAESFLSPAPGGGTGTGGAGGAVGALTPATGSAPQPVEGTGSTRAVEEADIYRHVGNLLVVLNAYRGLQILDLADAAGPRLLSRVPILGTPVDLYVRGSVAFVVVSDQFVYAVTDGCAQPQLGSALWTIDLSIPAAPVVLSKRSIDGVVDQTRIVGDVLYSVARRNPWYGVGPVAVGIALPASGGTGTATAGVASPGGTATAGVAAPGGTATTGIVSPGDDGVVVQSFDVSDPAAPREVARLELPATGWTTHAHVGPTRLTLSQSGWDTTGPVTWLRAIDISDAAGALAAGAAVSIAGTVPDRWALDFDDSTGVFRAVASSGWNAGATLTTWAWSAPGAAAALGRLELSVPESLTAVRFDGSRAYVVTAARVDPLFVVDTADPGAPRLVGRTPDMPGQLDYIEPRGDRLVALGHTNEAGQPWQLAVSLLDVGPAGPALLARVLVGASSGWVNAQADDLRKVLQVVEDPALGTGLVLVPVAGWNPDTWQVEGGTQLIDFAPQASDATQALVKRGFLSHPGSIRRAFVVDAARARLGALSDEAFQLVDASDRDAPVERARLDLARSVSALAVLHGKAVEVAGDAWRGSAELVVTGALDPDSASPLARVAIGAPGARLYRVGDVGWLLAHDVWKTGTAWLQAVDLSDPAHPVLRGRLDLAPEDAGGYVGMGGSWGSGDEALVVGHALVLHRSCSWGVPMPTAPSSGVAYAGCSGTTDALKIVDLSDPDHPSYAASVPIPDSSWCWGLHSSSGSFVWVTHYEVVPDRTDAVRYYVDRIDVSDPRAPRVLHKVNVPGVLFAAAADGVHLSTAEVVWPPYDAAAATAAPTTWIHALELTDHGTARLVGSTTISGSPSGTAVAGDHGYVVTWSWSGSQGAATLASVDLRTPRVESEQRIAAQWATPIEATAGKLFLQAGSLDQGVLIYGLATPGEPVLERFERTQGWVQDVVVDGSTAYLPSGPYGVPMVTLAP